MRKRTRTELEPVAVTAARLRRLHGDKAALIASNRSEITNPAPVVSHG